MDVIVVVVGHDEKDEPSVSCGFLEGNSYTRRPPLSADQTNALSN